MTSKEISQNTAKSDNSLAIKAITASTLVLFSTFMMVRWQRMLSQVETAGETAAPTAVTKAAAPSAEEAKTAASEPAAESARTEPAVTEIIVTEPARTEPAAESARTESARTEPAAESARTESARTEPAAESARTETARKTAIETEVAEPAETVPEASEVAQVEEVAPVEIAPATKILEPEIIAELNQKLYDKIDKSWRLYPSFEQNLAYRVNVKATGAIASYEPINQAAVDYLSETPIDTLSDAASSSEKAIAPFLVVLTPAGQVEVSPWLGQ